MTKRRIIITIFTILFTALCLSPSEVFAIFEAGGGGGTGETNASSKTASINFQYLTVTQSAGAQGTADTGSLGNEKTKKSTSGRISINVSYTGKEESGGRFSNTITGVRLVNITSKESIFHKDETRICAKISATGGCESYENGPTYGKNYSYDSDGNIVISTEEGYSGERGMTCTIKVANGTRMEDFNNSMKDCAEKMDKWTFPVATGGADPVTHEFGKITFTNTDGEKTVFNEENKSNAQQAEEAGMTEDSPEEAAEDAEGQEDVCYANAGVMGWVMCPAISVLSAFASTIYEDIVVGYLQVDADDILDGQGPTYQAWASFRDIANIVFVVFFLIVIISQLTGYGIDNYGIKRMLPRLIIAAILINLSFFICQLAVDIANIVGVSIGGLLSPQTLGITPETSSSANDMMYGVSLAVTGVGAIAGTAFIAVNFIPIISFLGVSGVIMCLLAIISVAISVLFLWLLLVARQAVVVILIIISPLALVAYLFPNTESLTKRYLKAAGGVLLLYPLCELIVNGGQLAGVILANASESSGESSLALAAMIVQVIPFFAIPSLLRNSMNGLGNLGAKITNVGQNARGAFDKVRKSDAVQDWHMSSMANNAKANAAIKKLKGKGGLSKALGNAMGNKQARAYKYMEDKLGQGVALDAAQAKIKIMQDSKWEKRQQKQLAQKAIRDDAELWEAQYEDDSSGMKTDFINAMASNDKDSGQIEGLVNSYMNNENFSGLQKALEDAKEQGASPEAMKRAADAMKNNRNFGRLSAKKTSLGEWAKTPGKDVRTAMEDNIESFKAKDWALMDGKERDAAVKTAKRLGESNNSADQAKFAAARASAWEALHNETLRGELNDEERRRLEDFVGGWQPSTQSNNAQPGQTLDLKNIPRASQATSAQAARDAARQQLEAVRAANGINGTSGNRTTPPSSTPRGPRSRTS